METQIQTVVCKIQNNISFLKNKIDKEVLKGEEMTIEEIAEALLCLEDAEMSLTALSGLMPSASELLEDMEDSLERVRTRLDEIVAGLSDEEASELEAQMEEIEGLNDDFEDYDE